MISAPPRNHIPEARIGDFSGTLPPQRSEEAQGRKRSSARRDHDFPAALIAVTAYITPRYQPPSIWMAAPVM